MRRVRFDDGAIARFGIALRGSPASWKSGRLRAMAVAVAFFALLVHAGELTGSFNRGGSQPVRAVRQVSPHEVESRESSVNSPLRLVVGLGWMMTAASTSGAELIVPSKSHPTIQSAINAASDGDTVFVAPGVYSESLQISGKALSLVGTGVALTIVDGAGISNSAPLLMYSNLATETASSISGFTFRNGAAGGVVLQGVRNLLMHDCEIRGCSATYGAALIPDGGNAVFERVVFRANSAFNGGAVNTANGFTGTFRRCAFIDNSATNTGGALIDFYSSSTLIDCIFQRNQGGAVVFSYIGSATSVGGGSFCGNTGPALAACCGGAIIDLGGNGEASSCPASCVGDMNADGVVDARDLGLVLYAWGTDGTQQPGSDIDGDGVVNGSDLAAVLNAWGPCPQ